MEFDNDLGLELLMNSKKKLPSDSISISSRSSFAASGPGPGPKVEKVDVLQHLVPPKYNRGNYNAGAEDDDDDNADEYEEGDDDEGDDEDAEDDEFSDSQENTFQQPRQQQQPQQQRFHQFQQQAPRQSDEDIINEKKELLYQFERLEKKGVRLPRKFTLASNLEEMRMEYERIKRDREIDTSVKFQKRMMMTAVSGIEFAADKFPFLGAKLSGWSNNVNDELDEYEDIFTELHDKYKGKAKMSPELRLLGGLAGSAFMYHLTHKFSNSLPGLDAVLKQNPELAAKLAEATRNQMNQQQDTAGSFFGNLGGMFGNIFAGGGQAPPPSMPPDMAPNFGSQQQAQQGQSQQQPQQSRPSNVRMRGPSNVDDILNELNSMEMNENRVEMMSNISENELLDELPDDVSGINGLFIDKNTLNL